MKKAVILVLSLLFLAPSAHAAESLYHRPQTEPEKVLDKILQLNDDDKNFDVYGFVFNYPDARTKDKEILAPLFTQNFLDKSEKEEKRLIAESCGGKYPIDGVPCEMFRSENPIACAQDKPREYLYRTIYSDTNRAFISYTWDEKGDGAIYRLVKQKDVWRLDANSCGTEKMPIPHSQ